MSTNTAEQNYPPQTTAEPVVALIPRVNISAFCEDQNTANVIQSAASDRRLSRAHLNVQLGGINAAVQVYHQQSTPDVLIVETSRSRDEVMVELGALAQVCEPETKVIVIGHLNDIILYRELMNAGVSDYIVAPLNNLQFIEAIANLYSDPEANPVGRVIAFAGAKGGVGSSTIAHNIGWYISKTFDVDTVITDLDLAFGTAGLNFNNDGIQGIAEALAAAERIDQVLIDRLLTKCSEKLSLLLAPGSVEKEVSVETDTLQNILDLVRASVPYVIADVPNVWMPWSKQTLMQADEVVITATPELASLRNTKNLIDFLKQARKNDGPPKLVMNQVGMPKRPEVPVAKFAEAVGVKPSIVIKHDAQVFGTANSNGQMIFEVAAKSEAASNLVSLAQLLTGRQPPVKQSKLSLPFLSKLQDLRKK